MYESELHAQLNPIPKPKPSKIDWLIKINFIVKLIDALASLNKGHNMIKGLQNLAFSSL